MKQKGAILSIVLAFGFVFTVMLGGLFSFILIQHRESVKRIAWEEAFQVAEAGIDYYKWCLNNGVEGSCEQNKDYYDGEGNLVGSFSLDIVSKTSCGETISKSIYSTGWSKDHPLTKRKVGVLYGRASVAKYAYLLNSNVWAGSDRQIRGLYHSNGGIRMDGENESLVTSAQDEWVCTSSFGCSSCPSSCRTEGFSCICPGVFTSTENANLDLFDYPSSSFDFEGITVDLAQIKSYAQAESLYFPPSEDLDSSADGYHLVFLPNGNFEVWIITRLWSNWAYSEEEGWHYDYFRIRNEYLYGTYSVSSSCPVIFVEDNLWVEGTVQGEVTLASANLISPTEETSIVLPGDITYTTSDGSDAFVVIGENNVLISPDSPNEMDLFGIFIAQKGHFGRNHYSGNTRDRLEITGSIVSNGRVGTQWTSGSFVVSGYLQRENYVDSNLIYSAPPFVPYAEYNFNIIKWEEIAPE